jgi:hypothetical protein
VAEEFEVMVIKEMGNVSSGTGIEIVHTEDIVPFL